MTAEGQVQEYLGRVKARLTSEGYSWNEGEAVASEGFLAVASRARFELTKFGFSEQFFVFADVAPATAASIKEFSGRAFAHALANKRIFLPRGIFESVYCFSVAISSEVDAATSDSIRNTTPERHWASAEVPVVCELSSGQLHYFEKTPLWGAAYYSGFRKTIVNALSGTGRLRPLVDGGRPPERPCQRPSLFSSSRRRALRSLTTKVPAMRSCQV